MLNIGIIGAGRMGGNHASHLAKIPGVRLAAVYDIDPARSAAFTEKYPDAKIARNARELAASPDVDLVLIASPTCCHREGVLAAMAENKAIFCEKPLCRTREDLAELAPLIRNYPGFFAIGFVRRYAPATMMMQKLISAGKIGKLICASVCCLLGEFRRERGDWFADYGKSGGVMLDMLAHHCDLLAAVAGRPVSVYARALMLDEAAPKPCDYVSATALFEGNCIANLECSWLRGAPSDTYITFSGEKGSLKLSDRNGLSFFDLGGAESPIEADPEVVARLPEGSATGSMYACEMAAIVDCLRNGKPPFAGAEDAIRTMEFCLGMMGSAESGKVVEFPAVGSEK